jgi:GT2 family glycosyltransferase
MRLSVVVPTHDTRELTLRCLASLAPLATRGAQVVLVDDASADGTAEAARRAFAWLEVLVNERSLGFARSANRGLARASGDLLLLLNSDTEMADTRAMEDAFASDPWLGAAGASLVDPDGGPQWSGGPRPTRAWLVGLASGLPRLLGALPGYRRVRAPSGAAAGPVDWVTGAALAIRREAWTQAGPLDETYRFYVQDLDLCIRLRDAGWGVRVVPGWRVMHVGGATIGRGTGAMDGATPALLWADLLEWTRRRQGAAWAARTAAMMDAAAVLRLGARSIGRTWRAGEERVAWDRDTDALRAARHALRVFRAGGAAPVS